MQLGKSRLPRHIGRLRTEASLFCGQQDTPASVVLPNNHFNASRGLLLSTARGLLVTRTRIAEDANKLAHLPESEHMVTKGLDAF